MLVQVLKSKIHRAVITESNLGYVGSITIDKALMDASGILEFEKVLVVDINNGARFDTYAIAGERHQVCLNGACARLGEVGDIVIIMSFGLVEEGKETTCQPKNVLVDGENNIMRY